jgi:hypothetical protein
MNKLFTFHISPEERRAIEILRQNDINISKFLRRQLRRFADQMKIQDQMKEHELDGKINTKNFRKF